MGAEKRVRIIGKKGQERSRKAGFVKSVGLTALGLYIQVQGLQELEVQKISRFTDGWVLFALWM